jgi:hypothetical protein
MDEGKRRERLNFNGFSGYYGYMSGHDGYGGFNYFSDFLYMNQSMWTAPNGTGYKYGWCDTGYQNEAALSSAKTLGWIYQYGLMESASSMTFDFKSMNAAASFSNNAVWDIISYTEKHGQLQVKAVDQLDVSYTGEHLTMNTLGKAGDFKHISAVAFELISYGSPGNSCTYGTPVIGVQLAIGDVKVKWNTGSHVNHHGPLLTPYLLHHQMHQPAGHITAAQHAVHNSGDTGSGHHSDAHHNSAAYHSELLAPGDESGITSQFHLPAMEHFLL